MCLLIYLPGGVLPDVQALQNGAESNTDGYGYAIVDGDRIVVHHGLDGVRLISTFQALRDRYRTGPALFHCRLATHGQRSIDNCHPFPVGGDPRTVIAHNGVLPTAVQPATTDPRSDTRIAAEQFLPGFGPLHQRRVRRRLARWMTPHNLMVLLTVDPRYARTAYLFNESSGIWDGGIWYSNDSYLPPRWTHLERGWDDRRWPADHTDRCGYCGAIIDPAITCPWCGSCPDCGQPPEHCQCYIPTALTRYATDRQSRRI